MAAMCGMSCSRGFGASSYDCCLERESQTLVSRSLRVGLVVAGSIMEGLMDTVVERCAGLDVHKTPSWPPSGLLGQKAPGARRPERLALPPHRSRR